MVANACRFDAYHSAWSQQTRPVSKIRFQTNDIIDAISEPKNPDKKEKDARHRYMSATAAAMEATLEKMKKEEQSKVQKEDS